MRYVAHASSRPFAGRVVVPGDKSLSHRAVLFGAMAEGISRFSGVLDSADVRSSIEAVRALGASVEVDSDPDGSISLVISGWGSSGPMNDEAVDCGNSGTTARLVMGIVAGWPVTVEFTGDESLSRRPMGRVTDPLRMMGARIEGGDTLPLTVRGGDLTPLDYVSPVASAQVKSCILLAGLRAAGRTRVTEPAHSRDHTERLLPAFGVPVGTDHGACSAWVDGPADLRASTFRIPGDPSSAAFLAVAAAILPGARVELPGVALNPTRTGFLGVLERMGADLQVRDVHDAGAEPVGTMVVSGLGALRSTTVTPAEVPSLVDEVPILAVAACFASGTTRFDGLAELRVKESDRLAAVCDGILALGGVAEVVEDSLLVTGVDALRGGVVDSLGDHRLAMAWAVAALRSESPVTIDRFEAIDVSYPGFVRDLSSLAEDVSPA